MPAKFYWFYYQDCKHKHNNNTESASRATTSHKENQKVHAKRDLLKIRNLRSMQLSAAGITSLASVKKMSLTDTDLH